MNKMMNRSDVFEALGLSSKHSRRNDLTETILPALGLFGAGILVGAGIALALAPKPGRELRADVYRSAGSLGNNLKERLPVNRSESDKNELGRNEDEVRASATLPPRS